MNVDRLNQIVHHGGFQIISGVMFKVQLNWWSFKECWETPKVRHSNCDTGYDKTSLMTRQQKHEIHGDKS